MGDIGDHTESSGDGIDDLLLADTEEEPAVNWTIQAERHRKDPEVLDDVTDKSSRLRSCITVVTKGWIRQELVMLTKLAFPIILALIFQNLLLFISIVYVGHISDYESLQLDSAALAISFANVTGLSIGIGLSTAAETLCSQSYGYKNYKKVGHVFQQGVMIMSLLSLFIWCVWLNTDSLMLLWQQSPCVARLAGQYVQIFCLALPPMFVFWMLQKYLQAQSIVWPFIITAILTNIISAIVHAVFIFGADMGVNGAALGMVIAQFSQPTILIIYVYVRGIHKKTWGDTWWSFESLRGWWKFLKLGVPGMLMICLEWAGFEIAAFILGSISEAELAVNTIIINMFVIIFMIPLGISVAGGIRVGNELGAGNPLRAKRASYLCIAVVAINAVIQVCLIQGLKNVLGLLYTKNTEVLEKLPKALNVVSPMVITDEVQFVIQGILRGSGHQVFGAVVNFIAYYIVGLPIGITLAIHFNMGTVGMWIGICCASFLQATSYAVFILRLNWKKEAVKAMRRVQSNEEEADDSSTGGQCSEPESGIDLQEQITEHGHSMEDLVDDEQVCVDKEDLEDLIISQDTSLTPDSQAKIKSPSCSKANIKLLLSKGSMFLVGAILVIISGVLSLYHPPLDIINGNYTECTYSNDTLNSTWSEY